MVFWGGRSTLFIEIFQCFPSLQKLYTKKKTYWSVHRKPKKRRSKIIIKSILMDIEVFSKNKWTLKSFLKKTKNHEKKKWFNWQHIRLVYWRKQLVATDQIRTLNHCRLWSGKSSGVSLRRRTKRRDETASSRN